MKRINKILFEIYSLLPTKKYQYATYSNIFILNYSDGLYKCILPNIT